VHIEPRYVAEFLALFWFGIILGLGTSSGFLSSLPVVKRTVRVFTILAVVSLLLPLTVRTCVRYAEYANRRNEDALAAAELAKLGIRPGDAVGRIVQL
jgi:hypothetical protein